MWMMGYNDGGELYMSDSINAAAGRNKQLLRPLIPRPLTAPTTSIVGPAVSTNRIHGGAADHFFNLNNVSFSEQNKRDFNYPNQQVVVSSRWNPTPEQLRALEELYVRGTRTPSAEQIQHITAQLRRYGKIEGKNVFYWFQNHKARERQKRRREMETTDDQSNRDVEERREIGASRTVYGVDQQQTKNWVPPINSTTTLPEESAVCTQKAAKGAAGSSECKSSEHHQWMKMDDRGRGELDQSQLRRNDTWQSMQQLSGSAVSINTPTMDPKQLFNYNTANPNPHLTPFLLSPPPLHAYYDILSDDGEEDDDPNHHFIIDNRLVNGVDRDEDDDNSQTLELFPLRSGDFRHDKDLEMSINNGFNTPHQFFEFLPMKN